MWSRRRSSDDFSAEIEAHLQFERERLQDDGFSDDEARASAHRAFGNIALSEERFYESHRWLWWDHFAQDLRYAFRMLRKSPGFAATAVLTIALGIGATTAIFSVVDATLLHPLPYPNSDELVSIQDDLPGAGSHDVGMSQPEWLDLQGSGIFQFASPTWFDENNLTGGTRPTRARLMIVAPNYFALLGVKPQLGRAFPPGDYSPSFTEEVVISDGMWKRDFGGDPSVLGKKVRLDTDLYQIVGVMPPGFRAPGRTIDERNTDIWAATSFFGPPMSMQPPRAGRNLPATIARLKPGLTLAAAQSEVDALVASLQKRFPVDYPQGNAWTVRLVPLEDTVVGTVRQSLVLLLGAVGLVLLIGCVNVANLMLARASARGREMAVRQALGAGRRRLARQLLTESLLLSVVGGVTGVGMLLATKGFLVQLVPESLPRLNDISINWGVLLFALGATIIAGAIFGLAPALHAGRLDVMRMLKLEGRGSRASGERSGTRRLLIVAEFALSLVLMVAAGLLLRSFWDLLNVRLGFNPESVMTIRTRLPYPNDTSADRYRTPAQKATLVRELLRRATTLPGVEQAALGSSPSIPLEQAVMGLDVAPLIIEGRSVPVTEAPIVHESIVTPEYFQLMGMTRLRGRLFTGFDDEKAPGVAVVNDAMGRTLWPNDDPIGKHVKLSQSATSWTTIVGIIADTRTASLTNANIPQIYANLYQRGEKHLAIFLRGHMDAASIPDAVREQVQAIDPTLPVFGAQGLADTISASLAERRFAMEIVGLFAVTALVLAALGIYGVISYSVHARTHEIGIRLALGAQGRTIVSMILRQGLGLTLAGAAVGLACALAASRLMAGLLYGVRPTDSATFLAVVVLLIAVALCACYIPARRAVRIGALTAMKCE
jgi:predicted permease